MKNVSVKNVDIIENVKTAIKPKSILKAFWDMIGGKPESLEQTDAQKEALEIYYTNNEKNIDRLEKLVTVPEVNKGRKRESKPKYEMKSSVKEQETKRETSKSKAEKTIDDDYVK